MDTPVLPTKWPSSATVPSKTIQPSRTGKAAPGQGRGITSDSTTILPGAGTPPARGKNLSLRPVTQETITPWLRCERLGKVYMPVPDNLASKTCSFSAGQALLSAMISDKYLGELRTRTCPWNILAAFQDQVPQAYLATIEQAWGRLRDSFCQYQSALREPTDNPVLPVAILQELIEASYVYGTLTRDPLIPQIMPFELDVIDIMQSGFLTRELLDRIDESDSEEYLSFLLNAMGVTLANSPWSNHLELEQSEIYHLGPDLRLSKPFHPVVMGPWIDVSFASRPGEYRPRGLQEYITLRSVSGEGDEATLDAEDAKLALKLITDRQQAVQTSTLPPAQKRTIIDKLAALKAKNWQQERVIHTSAARFIINDCYPNDGVCLRLKIGRQAGEQAEKSLNNQDLLQAPPPKDLNLIHYLPNAKFKEFYCHQRWELRKDQPGLPHQSSTAPATAKRYYISQVMPEPNGVRCRLSQAVYEMFAIPVARLTPIRRPNAKGKMSLAPDHKLLHAMEVLPPPASYAPKQVKAVIDNGGDTPGAVVIDALLGHRDVANSRLAVQPEPHQPLASPVPTIYRTDFTGCMGGIRSKDLHQRPYGQSAVADLEHLKKTMHASDESIRTGMARLAQLTDQDIHHLVLRHGTNSCQVEELAEITTLLQSRKASLLELCAYKPRPKERKNPRKIALSCQNKSHHEVATALADSDGSFTLPEVYQRGQRVVYRAQINAMLCQQGDSCRSNGHMISLFDNNGDWFVSDDLHNQAGALPLSAYLSACNSEYLIDHRGPNRWPTLINMLTKDQRLVTPLLLYGKRMGTAPRPEQSQPLTPPLTLAADRFAKKRKL